MTPEGFLICFGWFLVGVYLGIKISQWLVNGGE